MNRFVLILMLVACTFRLYGQETSVAKLDIHIICMWVVDDKTMDVELEFHNTGDDNVSYTDTYSAQGYSLLKFLLIREDEVYCAQRKKAGWWIGHRRSIVIEPDKRIRRMFSITPETWELGKNFHASQVKGMVAYLTLPAGRAHREGRYISSHASVHVSNTYNMTRSPQIKESSNDCIIEELGWQLNLLSNLLSDDDWDANELRNMVRHCAHIIGQVHRWEHHDEIIFYKKHIQKMIREKREKLHFDKDVLMLEHLVGVMSRIPSL